jgi:hypothetical protein
MGLTNFSYGVSSFGAPVVPAPGFYEKYLWVDGDCTSPVEDGSSPERAFTTIQEALDAAVTRTAVLILPRKIGATATDPVNYAEALTLAAGKSHCGIFGMGGGPAQGNQPQIKVGTGATANLTVRSPGCRIAGLSINGGSATGGGILLDDNALTKNAFGTIIEDCFFKNCRGSSATDGRLGGAIQWSGLGGAWQVRILRNRFYKNLCDILMPGTGTSVPQDVVIQDNIFSGAPGATSVTDINIYVAADGILGLVIDRNVFPNIPNIGSGSVTDFYDLGTGCYGIISNNVFGCTALTFGGTHTGGTHPATMWLVNNKQQAAVAQEAANLSPIGYTA